MAATEYVLSDDMLRGFAERCAGYDRENRFFQEDFDDLKRAGYLTMAVPKELGGRSAGLATTRPPRLSASTCMSTGSDW
jgi:alkylation response protein AidB-like acyl-CoA dehydrogenase